MKRKPDVFELLLKKMAGFSAESVGDMVIFAPKGFVNSLRLKVAALALPKEAGFMFPSRVEPKDLALLDRLGVQAFPECEKPYQESDFLKGQIESQKETQEQQQRPLNLDSSRGSDEL